VPVIVLLEVVVKFLRGFEQYGYVVRARDEEHKSNNNRGNTDCELSMGDGEREGLREMMSRR
jgi:hypothetical protein